MLDSLLRRFVWWRRWRGLPEPTPLDPIFEAIAREMLKEASTIHLFSLADKPKPMEAGKTLRIRKPNTYTRKVSST